MRTITLFLLALLLLLLAAGCTGTLEVGIERTATPDLATTATVTALTTENARLATQVATLSPPTPTPALNLGRLAYVQGGDIWVKVLPDGQPVRLTTDGRNSAPRWSPSGEWLAFRKGEHQVWVVRSDGSAAHPLNEGAMVGAFAWAPGEDRLAYAQGEDELQAINADGSGQAVLVLRNPQYRLGRIAWSPDGAWIAYEWREQQPKQPIISEGLWKASADGKERLELYEGPATLAGWTGDSRFVLFWEGSVFASASLMADGAPLAALPAEGGAPVRLAEPVLAYPDFVVPGPAGSAQVAVIVGGYRGAWTDKALHVISPPSPTGAAISPADRAASSPAWSPDGQRIAYAAMPDNGDLVGGEPARQGLMQRRIWVAEVGGASESQPLVDDPAYRDERPLWSADGSHILFARINAENRASLWLVSAGGGDPRRVVDELTPAPEWFGYYGHIDWEPLFDWWTGPRQAQE